MSSIFFFVLNQGRRRLIAIIWCLASLLFLSGWFLLRPQVPKSFPWVVTVDASSVPFEGLKQFYIEKIVLETEFPPLVGKMPFKVPLGWGGGALDCGTSNSVDCRGYKLISCRALIRRNDVVSIPIASEGKFDLAPGPLRITLRLQSDGHGQWEAVPQ